MKRPPPSALPERRPTAMESHVTSSNDSSLAASDRQKPVRVTVDLDPADYDALRDFAHETRMTHTGVLRSLVRLLDSHSVRQQVTAGSLTVRESLK